MTALINLLPYVPTLLQLATLSIAGVGANVG